MCEKSILFEINLKIVYVFVKIYKSNVITSFPLRIVVLHSYITSITTAFLAYSMQSICKVEVLQSFQESFRCYDFPSLSFEQYLGSIFANRSIHYDFFFFFFLLVYQCSIFIFLYFLLLLLDVKS